VEETHDRPLSRCLNLDTNRVHRNIHGPVAKPNHHGADDRNRVGRSQSDRDHPNDEERHSRQADLTSADRVRHAAADLHRKDGCHAGTEKHDRNLGGIQAELVTE
jgi:hypothetical protein